MLRSTVIGMILLAFLSPSFSLAMTEEAKAKGRAAVAAGKEGKHEESYRLWMEVLSRGVGDLGEEGYAYVRSQVYHEAAMKIEEIGDGDCAKTIDWAERGRKPGPPAYSDDYDVFYPALLIAEGVCYARQAKYEDAHDTLMASRLELRKAPPQAAAEFFHSLDQYLEALRGHIIMEGDYVTNDGFLQKWIGKVVSRSGSQLEIQITYVNKALAGDLSKHRVHFSAHDCKVLGAISLDAAAQGWQQ